MGRGLIATTLDQSKQARTYKTRICERKCHKLLRTFRVSNLYIIETADFNYISGLLHL